MDERTENSRKEAEAKKAEVVRKAEAVSKALSDFDKKYADLDAARKALPDLTKKFSEMTPKENAAARRVLAEQWRKGNPEGDVSELYAMLNRLDADPKQTGGQMMMQIVAGAVPELVASGQRWGSGALNTLSQAPAAVQEAWVGGFFEGVRKDIFENPGAQWSDLLSERGGWGVVSDLGSALKESGVSLGQGGMAMIDQVVQTIQSGDSQAITRMLADTTVGLVAETVLEFGMGRAVGLSTKAMGSLAQKVQAATRRAPKAPDAPVPKAAGVPTPAKPAPKAPRNMADAPEGTAIDSAAKAKQYGMTTDEMRRVEEVAKGNDVILETRPSNVARLNHLDTARMKPESIKTKTINEFDTELGFRKKDEGLLGALTEDMYADLNQMSPSDVSKLSKGAQQRRLDRIKEYDDRAPDLAKVEKGVDHRIPDPKNPGKAITEKLKASRDKHGVIRDPSGKGFTGDIDLHDVRHGDGRSFFRDHDGRMLGYDSRGRRLKKGTPEYDADSKTLRADREKMVKVIREYKEKVGGEHGGGYYNPQVGWKFDKDGIPIPDCKNLDLNKKINAEAAEGLGVVRFGADGKPTKVFGSGKPRYGEKYTPEYVDPKTGKKVPASFKGGHKPERMPKLKPKAGPKSSQRPGALKPKPAEKPAMSSKPQPKSTSSKPPPKSTPKPKPSGGKKK